MHRRGVAVITFGVIAVRILAGVEQQPDDVHVALLRRQSDRAMPLFSERGGEKPFGIGSSSQSRGSGERCDSSAAPYERLSSVLVAECQSSHQRRSPRAAPARLHVRTGIEKRLDEGNLHTGVGRMTT